MNKGILNSKSYAFALRIIKMCQYLRTTHKEYLLSKQVIRSGTAIGALIRESEFAESPADFVHKLSIALKEANETAYWLSLLKDSTYLSEKVYLSLSCGCDELLKMLVASIKTAKKHQVSESV